MPNDAAGFDEIDPIARDATLLKMSDVTDRPNSSLPSAQQYPNCRGCGTSVAAPGDLCDVCAQKPAFAAPKATIETAPQPDPAYAKGGPAQARTSL